jgi:hypothetical protein
MTKFTYTKKSGYGSHSRIIANAATFGPEALSSSGIGDSEGRFLSRGS